MEHFFFDFSISCGVLNCSDSTLSYTMQDKSVFKPIIFHSTQENITDMLKHTPFSLKWGEKSVHSNLLNNLSSTYFTLVLEK